MAQISLQEALREYLNSSKVKTQVQSLQIREIWKDVMGATIANYTDDIQLIRHQLIITTHVAPLKQELLFQKEKIRNRINEQFNEHIVHEVLIK